MFKHLKKRHLLQLFFFVLIGIIAVNHTLAESGGGITWLSSASLHAICPFGGVVTLYQLVTLGTFVQKIHISSVILMGLVFLLAVLFGPVFCGWVCPLGSIQEWFGKIGKKIFKKRYNQFIPKRVDRVLRWLRYVILARVLYMTAMSGYLVFAEIDPYHALYNFWSSETAILSIIVLLVVLVMSLFVERPWCKYACPYGAVLSITNKISIFKLKRTESNCINCKKCDDVCPMNIEVSGKDVITDLSCIRCMQCTSENSCPVSDTVTIEPVQFQGGRK
ncbi:4Fe-4S binding protein [Fusibacter paucivorans]|uniref:4Fe-4S binding protein n=1 Tax=Fusibacter paucivorans TaxID=76009 RepID=A0ABS5PPE5_9FIRM|nr:4Fe-4S binding protein [Fusibacter paucivorans]MBS7527030.1 4Fe-4S binding protein [Fusibacter paucivorans]